MNRILTGAAVLLAGLLLFCPKVDACDWSSVGEMAWGYSVEMVEKVKEEQYIEPTYYIPDKDVDLLVRVGVLEGGETDVDGIANVIQVIINRVESDNFPNTISEVIFQTNPRQFATASKLATANITPEAYAALDAVVFGEYEDNDCLYFESESGRAFSSWADYQFSYGGHDFYKSKEV